MSIYALVHTVHMMGTSYSKVTAHETLVGAKWRLVITIDEAYFYAQHGSILRDKLQVLVTIFFVLVFKAGASLHPLFLVMIEITAMMTNPLLVKLFKLTNMIWTEKKHYLWTNADTFKQRYIKVSFQDRDHMSCKAFPSLVAYIKSRQNWG